jgi:GTPase SAR1 family protein
MKVTDFVPTEGNEKIQELYLENDLTTLSEGSESNVDINSYGNFQCIVHTHPKICYEKAQFCAGWPSVPDLISSIVANRSVNTLLYVIATLEGVYYYQCTPDFSFLIKHITNDECFEALINIIIEYLNEASEKLFAKNQAIKHVPNNEELIHQHIREYINEHKTITLKKIINKSKDKNLIKQMEECVGLLNYNIRLFDMELSYWSYIEKTGLSMYVQFYG